MAKRYDLDKLSSSSTPTKKTKPEIPISRPRMILESSSESWKSNDIVRIGAVSRFDWGEPRGRAGLIIRAFQTFAEWGTRYNVIAGGLVSNKAIRARIKLETAGVKDQNLKIQIEERIIEEIAAELDQYIPVIKVPLAKGKSYYVKTHVIPSQVLDGRYGDPGNRVLRSLQQRRREYDDIRLLKPGTDITRIKGHGRTEEEKQFGRVLQWVVPTRNSLPSKYASSPSDKDIDAEKTSARITGTSYYFGSCYGTCTSAPSDKNSQTGRSSIPACHVPIARAEGESSLALNQVGVTIFNFYRDMEQPEKIMVSFRDLIQRENDFITGIKEGSSDIHRKIVSVMKKRNTGLSPSDLAEELQIPIEKIVKEIAFLTEEGPLYDNELWSGLYYDQKSNHYYFSPDWIIRKIRYPAPYTVQNLKEFSAIFFGCPHVGYTTTDYEMIRFQMPKIVAERGINAIVMLGDLIAGLKHGLMERGQVISNLTYTEQETLAGEIWATNLYEEFARRFAGYDLKKVKNLEEVIQLILDCLMWFYYILGNHDAWQKDSGQIPGDTFRRCVRSILTNAISKLLHQHKLPSPPAHVLSELVRSRVIEVSSEHSYITLDDDLRIGLWHPNGARAMTKSLRAESAMSFFNQEEIGNCQAVAIANFHEAVTVLHYDVNLGQRMAIQAGTFAIYTQFERGLMKNNDVGYIHARIYTENGRIVQTSDQFLTERIMKEALPKHTDVFALRRKLGLLPDIEGVFEQKS